MMDIDDWLAHMKHLELGSRYIRNCPVCELRSARQFVDGDVKKDADFYKAAQRSGKRSIPL